MQNQKLEWADIAYFSKGRLSVSNDLQTTITIDKDLDPAEFVVELLAAGAKAELTLNATAPLEERANNFPGLTETPLVFNAEQKQYTKTVSYTFTQNVTLSPEEVES